MDEHEVINAFISHLEHHKGYPNLRVDRWPDVENRQSPEIDAIAGPFAIEHTSIDSVANQRRDDDWFSRVIDGLDRVITDCVDCGFTITLEYDAIRKGMDWNCIRDDLERWILDNAPLLSYGSFEIVLPTSAPVDKPIVMSIWKGRSRRIGFARFAPLDDTLRMRAKNMLDRKTMKLTKYRAPGTTTILLVENDDIALMDELKMLDAIREVCPDGFPRGVDEIWFADTSIPDEPRFRDFTTEIANVCPQPSLQQ